MQPYRPPPKPIPNPWIYVGPASSITDITPTSDKARTTLSSTAPPTDPIDIFASPSLTTACKILQLPSPGSCTPQSLTPDAAQTTLGTRPQILIFRYHTHIHAIDHACPHQNFPLSRARLYDIEDFGIILSAGIECPKHGWSFDLTTGQSDRGGYKLGVWEVEVRGGENGFGEREEEVWVRRKERKRAG